MLTWLKPAPQSFEVSPYDPWGGSLDLARLLREGVFEYKGESFSLRQDHFWERGSLECNDFLQSFEWIRSLRSFGDGVSRNLARSLVRQWIEEARFVPHPRRLANWVKLYSFFGATGDDTFRSLFFKSAWKQRKSLISLWRESISPFHKMGCLSSLLFFDLCTGQKKSIPKTLSWLSHELPRYLSPEGGFASEKIQDHLMVMRDLIDLRALLARSSPEVGFFLSSIIDRMAPALRFFRHRDGKLCFLGESEDDSHTIDLILSHSDSKERPPQQLAGMGYGRMENAFFSFIAGHKGCWELSHGRERIFLGQSPSFQGPLTFESVPPYEVCHVKNKVFCLMEGDLRGEDYGAVSFYVHPHLSAHVKKDTLVLKGEKSYRFMANVPLSLQTGTYYGNNFKGLPCHVIHLTGDTIKWALSLHH